MNDSKDSPIQILLRPVCSDNWRDVAGLQVAGWQREFTAEPTHYLALCCYGRDWKPLAIYLGEQVIGFLMWSEDVADGSCWLGGIMVDHRSQRQGYGGQAIRAAITMLAEEHGYQQFALSYLPHNPARRLYHRLGFVETGETEGDEVVARLSLAGAGPQTEG